MKKDVALIVALLMVCLFSSCVFSGQKLKPGDQIGEMRLDTDMGGPVPELTTFCEWVEIQSGTCEVPATTTQLCVSTGWAEDTLEELNGAWEESDWKLTIDGQEIDLDAFGTFDLTVDGQKSRIWNVCLYNPTVGTHSVQYEYSLKSGSRPGNHTAVMDFTVVETESQ